MSSLFGELICGVVDPLVVKLGYGETGLQKVELARSVQQCLCIESTGNNESDGITLFSWESKEDIRRWRDYEEDQRAQMMGKGQRLKNLGSKSPKLRDHTKRRGKAPNRMET